MWENLSKYLHDKKIIEIGCGIGQKTKNILRYTDNVTAIDISKENIRIAQQQFDSDKVHFLVMNASKLDFPNKSFDIAVTTDSFHEIDSELQDNVLSEMVRIANMIIFIEPDEVSVTNELFKVFDPNENHSMRIKKSLDKAFQFMNKSEYELKETGNYNDITKFNSKEEMFETLLDWWNDIKIPKDINEKTQMINQMKNILQDFDMLDKMEVFEKIHYYVFEKEKRDGCIN